MSTKVSVGVGVMCPDAEKKIPQLKKANNVIDKPSGGGQNNKHFAVG